MKIFPELLVPGTKVVVKGIFTKLEDGTYLLNPRTDSSVELTVKSVSAEYGERILIEFREHTSADYATFTGIRNATCHIDYVESAIYLPKGRVLRTSYHSTDRARNMNRTWFGLAYYVAKSIVKIYKTLPGLGNYRTSIDTDALISAILSTHPRIASKAGYGLGTADQKRLHRFIKQNFNRFLYTRKEHLLLIEKAENEWQSWLDDEFSIELD